jgi:hypothetical protein
MDRSFLMGIVLVILVVLLALLVVGWRSRQRRQKSVAAPHVPPADLGSAAGTFDGKYVATTAHDDPYDRINVHGLGFRGNSSVTVTDLGLLVQRPGEHDTWIPAADVRAVRRATWTIDRVVEPDGLQLVEWTLGDRVVDTYFRMDEPAAFDAAVAPIIATERQAP